MRKTDADKYYFNTYLLCMNIILLSFIHVGAGLSSKFELTPIVNLFTEENLDERYNVSSVTILEWFLPLYLKYCKVYKYCDLIILNRASQNSSISFM